jgi:hypothetical protein
MKLFRFIGLLIVTLALLAGATSTARATGTITCWKNCSGHYYSGYCTQSLDWCCRSNHICPYLWEFEEGDCTDGTNSCPV